MPLAIQLSRVDGWDSINLLNLATFFSQTRNWISNVTCRDNLALSVFSYDEKWLFALLTLMDINITI